jgi:glutathione S-transferase
MAAKKVKLYMFSGSNSVLTGRLLLEHKEIDYKPVQLIPAMHAFVMLGLGFPTMAVPGLKIDGRKVQGTRHIARLLDELYPSKPLYPADPVRRKAVEDAERWGEELQNATRRIFYCCARRDPAAFRSVMSPGRSLMTRAILRVSTRLIIRLATGAHRATDEAGREDVSLLPERLDQVDAWIAEGVLDGEELNAADYQIGVNVRALLFSEDLAPYVVGRPAEAFARRVAPDYPGDLPAVLPPEWLPPLPEGARSRDPATPAGESLPAVPVA